MFLNLPRSVWLLGVVSLLTDVASEAIYPLLPIFLATVLGAGAGAIGIIEGIAESTASLMKMVSGWWSDQRPKRKPFVIAGYTLSSLCRPLIGLAPSWPIVLFLRFADRIGKGIRTAPRDAMLATLAPAGEKGKVFGFHRSMDHLGAIIGPLLATLFLAFWPGEYRALFLWAAVPGIASVIVLLFVPEGTRSVTSGSAGAPRTLSEWKSLNPAFRRFLGVVLIFSLGNSTDAFLLLRLNHAGIEAKFLPLMWALLHVVKSASATAGGIASDRFGRKKTILTGWIWYALVYLGLAFSHDLSVIIALFLGYGLFFGLTEGSERALVADLAGAREGGLAFGTYHATVGFALLPASLIFGFLWQAWGFQVAFTTGAAFAMLAAFLLWRVPVLNAKDS